jgi:Outer membrane protein beta-barrel domain
MRFRFVALATCLTLATVAGQAVAQDRAGTWEISPFAGGFFGGRLYGPQVQAVGGPSNQNYLVEEDDLAYGARLAYNVTRHFGFEVDWTSSRNDLHYPRSYGISLEGRKAGTLRQNIYEANAVFNFGRRHVIGYVGIGAGSAVEKRDIGGVNPAATGRFTANISAGGKFFFVPRVGLRIDGRYRAINLTDDRDGFSCDHNGFRDCDNRRRNWSYNGELTGGLVFAF